MPWRPPIMLVSIVGHASFHTAGPSGPSTIDRSYFRRSGTAAGAPVSARVECALSATNASAYPHLGRVSNFGEDLSIGSPRRLENVKAVICAFDPMHLPVCLHVFENGVHQVGSAEWIACAVEAYDRNLDGRKMRIAKLLGLAGWMQWIRECQ